MSEKHGRLPPPPPPPPPAAALPSWCVALLALVCFALPQAVRAQNTPGKPTITALVPKGGCFIVKWSAPDSDGGSAITGYDITPQNSTTVTINAGANAREAQWPGTCSTDEALTHNMAVRASNANGDGAWSDTVNSTVALPVLTADTAANAPDVTLSITQMANAPWYYKGTQTGATCMSVAKGTASATVTGLTVGTEYTYGAYYEDTCSQKWGQDRTLTVTFTPVAAKPPKPTSVTVTGGNASVTLGWTSGGNGGSAITKWQYLKNADGTWDSTWTDICETSTDSDCPSTTSHTVSSLNNGTAYKFKVRAVNTHGDGAESDASASVVPAGKPPKPAKPTVEAGHKNVIVSSSVSWNNGSAITMWRYKKKASGTWDADWTDVPNSAGLLRMTVTAVDLTNGTTYTFKVQAVNGAGASDESDDSDDVTPMDSSLEVEDRTETTATLSLAGYPGPWRYKGGEGGSGTCTAVQAGTTTVDLDSLKAGTSYTYTAHNDSDADCPSSTRIGNPRTFSTLDFKLSTKTNTTANLVLENWTQGQAWSYRKEYPGTGTCKDTTLTSVSVDGLSENTSYTYRAYRGSGCTGGSIGTVHFKTTPAHGFFVKKVEDAITATTAKLELSTAGADLAWWHQKTAGPGAATCVGLTAGNDTADLSGLTAESSYTWAAYRRDGCAHNHKIDDVDFATKKPPKSARPTVTAGNAQVTLTSSVTYTEDGRPAITKWQYIRKEGGNAWETNWKDISGSADNTLSTTITGLRSNTSYQFKVRAVNSVGSGTVSDASTAVTTPAVTLTAGSVEHGTATLTLANHSGNWWLKRTTPADTNCKSKGTTATESLTGLTGNTSYTWKAYSNSDCSTELAAHTFLTRPAKPGKPTATAGAGSGKLTLTATLTGGSGALSKWEYTTDGGTNWTDITTDTDNSLSHVVTGLTDGTNYTFKVRATNATGTGPVSDASDAVAPADESLTAGSITHEAVKLTLANHPGNWYYKEANGTCSTDAVSTTSVDLDSLAGNTSYTYSAYSDSGCTSSKLLATASAFLTRPAKPGKPTATAGAGSGKLTLAATLTGGSGALTQWEYTTDGGTNWTAITTDTDNSLSHVVTGLTDGTNYTFKVRATNATGTGPASDASTAVAPVDEALTAGSITHNAATLTLTNHPGSWWLKRTTPADTNCKSKGTTATESLSSLKGNTSYTYKAYSNNTCTSTKELATETFLTKPAKPGTPTATADVGSGRLTLTATLTGGTGALTKWEYTTDDGTTWNSITTDTDNSLSHVVTGLTNGTDYTFKVRATNATGTGSASDASTAVAPTAPTLAAASATVSGMKLTIGNWSAAWHYKYTIPDGGQCSSSAVAAGNFMQSVTTLTANTVYTFAAYSDGGCSELLASAGPRVTLPPKPTTPTVGAGVGSGKLALSSSATTGGDLAFTRWQYTTDDGATWKDIPDSTSTTLSHTVSGLDDDTSYTFKVRAVNASGEGAASEPSQSVAPKDETLTVSDIEATEAKLTIGNWSADWYYKYTSPDGGQCSSKVSGTEADVSGLTENTSYTFKAFSDTNCSMELAAAAAFPTLPPQPAKPTMTIGDTRLTLSSSVSGNASLTEWQYKRKEGTGSFDTSWTKIDNKTSKTLSHTFTGLTNNTYYSYKVRAVNASGEGEESEASESVAPLEGRQGGIGGIIPGSDGTPLAPSKPTVTGGDRQVTLSWTSNGDGGSAITKWQYVKRVGDGAFETTWTDIPGTGEDTTTHVVTGLTNGAVYRFKVRAVNAVGVGAASPESDAVTPAALVPAAVPPPAPSRPTVARGDGRVTLSWTSNGDGGSAITKWQYVKQAGDAAFETAWTDIPDSGEDTATHAVTGLANGTAYRFKVRAVNAVGAGVASPASGPVTPAGAPPAPGRPTVAGGDGRVALAWASSGNGGSPITRWQYVKQAGDDIFETTWTDVPGSNERTTTYTVTGLTNGVAYRFKVRAMNVVGAGGASPESDVVMPAAPAVAPERLTRVSEMLVPEFVRAMVSSVVDAVRMRFGRAASGPEETVEMQAALESAALALAGQSEALEEGTVTLREALGGVSFVQSLAADGGSGDMVGDTTVWGVADYRNLSGGGEAGLPWDGGWAACTSGWTRASGAVWWADWPCR